MLGCPPPPPLPLLAFEPPPHYHVLQGMASSACPCMDCQLAWLLVVRLALSALCVATCKHAVVNLHCLFVVRFEWQRLELSHRGPAGGGASRPLRVVLSDPNPEPVCNTVPLPFRVPHQHVCDGQRVPGPSHCVPQHLPGHGTDHGGHVRLLHGLQRDPHRHQCVLRYCGNF